MAGMNMDRFSPSEIQQQLENLDYPVSKQELIEQAQEMGAPQQLISVLEQVQQEEFNSPSEVTQALGRVA